MRNMIKKIIALVMIAIFSSGICVSAIEASPRDHHSQQRYEHRDNRGHEHRRENVERRDDRQHQRDEDREARRDEEMRRHEREMERRDHEDYWEWQERQRHENERHEDAMSALGFVALLYILTQSED